MKQPALGIVASAIIIAISLGFISLFDFNAFSGWVTYCLICLIPMEVVAGVVWGANPSFAASASQPGKGLILCLVCLVAGAIIGPIYWQLVGAGAEFVAPMLMICSIVCVALMFFMTIVFGGWPFMQMFGNPVAAGFAIWVACYLINYIQFRIFFNFDFMQGAPVYIAAADPGGMFNGNNAVVFEVTVLFGLFLLLHFDLWPFTTKPSLMKQPTLGIVWLVFSLILAVILYGIGVNLMGMDSQLFLIRVPIPFIFGTIIVLNMLHNSLFASLKQPVKGIANTAAALVIGNALAMLYTALAPTVTGNLAIGPPTNDFERWLASALLGVTFPFLVAYAEFFKMWPLTGSAKAEDRAAAAAKP